MKHLNSKSVAQFQQAGYLYPVSIITEAEAKRYRASLEAYEQKLGHPVQGPQRTKPHLLFKWVDDLMRNEIILDCVEAQDEQGACDAMTRHLVGSSERLGLAS